MVQGINPDVSPIQGGTMPSILKVPEQLAKPFMSFLDEALGTQQKGIQAAQGASTFIKKAEIDPSDDLRIAQVFPESAVDEIISPESIGENLPDITVSDVIQEGYRSHKLDITPFQLFMDKSIAALENISDMEVRVNDLMEQYIQGRASIDEVSIETAKLNLAISFATSVLTSATQTFKEILQMAI
jgi:flagellar hook-basal body complex protein FliE